MESFDALLHKSIKAGKEFRFYTGAVLIISIVFSFLVFLSSDKTFTELLQRENGLISMMYMIMCGILAVVFLYLMSLYRHFFNTNIRNIGILIAMGMPRKRIKSVLFIRTAVPVIAAVVTGTVAGFGVYDIVILNGVIHAGGNMLQNISIVRMLSVIVLVLFVCYVGIMLSHSILNCKNIVDIVSEREMKMKRNSNVRVMAIVGLISLVGGNIFLLVNKIRAREYSNLVPVISIMVVIFGVYLSIFSFGYWFPAALEYRDKNRKNILLLNEIRNNFRNDAKALSAYAIINWINIFLFVVIVMLWKENGRLDFSDSPYDYVLEFEDQGYEDMMQFMNRNEKALCEWHILKSLEGETVYGETKIILIPEADYNKMTGQRLEIENGHMVVLSQLDRSMADIIYEPDGREWHYWEIDQEVPIDVCGVQFSFITDYEIWKYLINCEDSEQRILILSDDDFSMLTQHESLQYKLCVNIIEGMELDKSSLQENNQFVHILNKQEHFIKMQRENTILLVSLIAMLTVLNIILYFTQMLQYCSEKDSRRRDSYIQRTLGIKEEDKKKIRQKSLQIKNFLPVLGGGLTGCLCTICFIKDMNIYLAILAVAAYGAEIMMQMVVYVVEKAVE
ncbi:MAG: ABC transporter permease [Lachnospiraceae bacterium]|nr:ABC transporter permease [Lachnospiraceae bacterium]